MRSSDKAMLLFMSLVAFGSGTFMAGFLFTREWWAGTALAIYGGFFSATFWHARVLNEIKADNLPPRIGWLFAGALISSALTAISAVGVYAAYHSFLASLILGIGAAFCATGAVFFAQLMGSEVARPTKVQRLLERESGLNAFKKQEPPRKFRWGYFLALVTTFLSVVAGLTTHPYLLLLAIPAAYAWGFSSGFRVRKPKEKPKPAAQPERPSRARDLLLREAGGNDLSTHR